jgi:Fe-S-cluster-containing hydrogenase component 2
MGKGIAYIDYQVCMSCRVCILACPFSYFDMNATDPKSLPRVYPALVVNHKCTGCGLCATACPVECIVIHA